MIPQILILAIFCINFGYYIGTHGEYEDRPNNFWIRLLDGLLVLGILFWGGFFDILIDKF